MAVFHPKVRTVPKWERRIFQLGTGLWGWEIRRHGREFKLGKATGPADANRQIRAYIAAEEARDNAKWVTVDG